MKQLFVILLVIISTGLTSCRKEDTQGKELTILTEVLKPFNYEENGLQKGITMELVSKILGELDLTQTIEVSSDWNAQFNRLKTGPNIMLFTTIMTLERKDQFQWVGPVCLWNDAFVALKGSGLSLASWEDAKLQPAIGVVKAFSSSEILINLGFKNLHFFDTFEEMIRNLYNGTVGIIFDAAHLIHIAAQDHSLDPALLDNLLYHSSTPGYLAFSKDVSANVVKTWQEKLDELKDEGFLQGLYDKYLPGTVAPGRILMFTEENPPQSYRDVSGNLTGSSVDMVKEMMKEASITGNFEYTNWTNAYNQILFVPNTMAFSTLRSSSREDLFHWVGPLCKKRYCFYVLASTDYQINTIDDARHMISVGTVDGWSSEEELLGLGFTNVVTWATPQEVFLKLMNGDISCAVLNDISMRLIGLELGHPPKDYRKGAVLSEGQTYIAFSLDTDASYINQWETAYQSLVSTGKFSTIWNLWYPDIEW